MKPTRTLVMALTFLTLVRLAGSQSAGTGIQLVDAHPISVDEATRPHVESFLAVDPRDPGTFSRRRWSS